MKSVITTSFLSLILILSLASQCPSSGGNNPPGGGAQSNAGSTNAGLTNAPPANPPPTNPPATNPSPTNPVPANPVLGNFDEHVKDTYKTQQYCSDMGFFWSDHCLTFHAAKKHCESTKEGPLNHPYSVKGSLHCGGLRDADENCRQETKMTYNQHTGHCEGEVVINDQARTHKDYCLRSGYHWVDNYAGKNKCFTAQEFDVYSTYEDHDSCTQNGYFWRTGIGGWFTRYTFCATFSKGVEHCREQQGKPYVWYATRIGSAICGDLKQAEYDCNRWEGGKKYNPANGHCE